VKLKHWGPALVVAVWLVLVGGPATAATTITVPSNIPRLLRSASSLTLPIAVTGPNDAYVLTATLGPCSLEPVPVLSNHVETVTFDLSQCRLADLTGSNTNLEISVGGPTTQFNIALGAPSESGLPWNSGLKTPLRWGLLGGVLALALCLGALYGYKGNKMAQDVLSPPNGKIRPSPGERHLGLPWALPGQPMSNLDWTGGIVATLVFLGGAIASVLALSAASDPVFNANHRLVLAGVSIAAALVAGTAALAVAGFQAQYTPTYTTQGPRSFRPRTLKATPANLLRRKASMKCL
jgi:hypothetical protein